MSSLTIPAIIVNFKVYSEVEGPKARLLAQKCQEVSEASGINISVCPPMVELSAVASSVHIPVLAQHVDDRGPGSNTGWVTAQTVKSAGAAGTLLNHSEHRLSMAEIEHLVSTCRSVGLQSVVCADSEESAAQLALFAPDFVAVEPPELIGGEVSVTDAQPEVIERAVNAVKRVNSHVPVLCGAGVKTGRDVRKAIDLGAAGVLLASGVVKSKDVKKTLEDLVSLV